RRTKRGRDPGDTGAPGVGAASRARALSHVRRGGRWRPDIASARAASGGLAPHYARWVGPRPAARRSRGSSTASHVIEKQSLVSLTGKMAATPKERTRRRSLVA